MEQGMSDERDRFGDKLREAEKALEDQWAHDRDRDLLDKLRARLAEQERMVAQDLKIVDRMREANATNLPTCPKCHQPLVERSEHGAAMLSCPANDGAWLDRAVLDQLMRKST
jgi:uncharacterized protein with PIN domain